MLQTTFFFLKGTVSDISCNSKAVPYIVIYFPSSPLYCQKCSKNIICKVFLLFIYLFLLIYLLLTEIKAPSLSREQDKAVSEHSIPLGKHNKFYYHFDSDLNVLNYTENK